MPILINFNSRYANTRGDKHWFAKPCRPFHEIVYAKQKGFPYWPAKVVGKENSDGQLEVRFFGGFHQRALVDRHHIKPITTNIHRYKYFLCVFTNIFTNTFHSLQIKRTSAWNKASEELKRYQELHEKYKDKPEFTASLYGDPFDGEKVSQLTTIGGLESESESEDEQHREPGDPGTRYKYFCVCLQIFLPKLCSMPIMDATSLLTSPLTGTPSLPGGSTMMTPVTVCFQIYLLCYSVLQIFFPGCVAAPCLHTRQQLGSAAAHQAAEDRAQAGAGRGHAADPRTRGDGGRGGPGGEQPGRHEHAADLRDGAATAAAAVPPPAQPAAAAPAAAHPAAAVAATTAAAAAAAAAHGHGDAAVPALYTHRDLAAAAGGAPLALPAAADPAPARPGGPAPSLGSPATTATTGPATTTVQSTTAASSSTAAADTATQQEGGEEERKTQK